MQFPFLVHASCWAFCVYVSNNLPSNPSQVGTVAFMLQTRKRQLAEIELLAQNHLSNGSADVKRSYQLKNCHRHLFIYLFYVSDWEAEPLISAPRWVKS